MNRRPTGKTPEIVGIALLMAAIIVGLLLGYLFN